MFTFLPSSRSRDSRVLGGFRSIRALARAIVALIAAFLCSCACLREAAPAKSRSPVLAVGYFHGPVGFEVLFYSGGDILYIQGDSQGIKARLGNRDRRRLEAFLNSATFTDALADLRRGGYEPGCCDQHEVAITYEDSSIGYPVCEEVPVSAPVRTLVDLVNEVARSKFGSRYSHPLPSKTCRDAL